jgi:hypothetical protein
LDIDSSILLKDLEFLQPKSFVADMGPIREVELIPVPGTDDMHVDFVVALTQVHAARTDFVDDLGHSHALAGWATLMWTIVSVGIELALVADDPDLQFSDVHDAGAAVLELFALANENSFHVQIPTVCSIVLIIRYFIKSAMQFPELGGAVR